ncbi:MAG: hydroxymethylpyrimidine/phosphomethylpyrimidine kinase [Deltaproteobacteria bacterium]|nr:hydroxymethylpyrimidine/phosphomethylpyrimidine kinase [Deltaproteobacteria bacterium]
MSDVPPIVLTVAGSDPSGGAGLQSDLKTIHQHGAYGVAVPTLITVQSTVEVLQVELLSPDLVRAQLGALLGDILPAAAKTGALGSPTVAHILGSFMEETTFPWVVDPVWLPTRGRPLAMLTPNAQEAALLAEVPVRTLDDARGAAERIAGLGASAVLITGGHLEGASRGTDLLLYEGEVTEFPVAELIPGRFHGTGCALSAAIATRLGFTGPPDRGPGGQGVARRVACACLLSRQRCPARESFLAFERETLALIEVLQTL